MLLTLAVAILSGALAAALALLLIRNPERRNDRIALAIGVFLLFNGVARAVWVKPRLAEAARMKVPIYRALKTAEPAMYEEVKADETDRDGTNQTALLVRIRAHTAMLLKKYGPRASDESLRQLIAVSVEQMETIARISGDSGTSYASPSAAVDVPTLSTNLTEGAVQRQLGALAEVVRSGATSPPQPIDAARADMLLQVATDRAMYAMGNTAYYGSPNGTQMTIALYRQVLQLPPEDSALAIRRMLSKIQG